MAKAYEFLEGRDRHGSNVDLLTPDVAAQMGDDDVAAGDVDARELLSLAAEHDAQGPSASEQAFNSTSAGSANGVDAQSGGFLGFGAGFNPYSWTDPHVNHPALGKMVNKLHAQQVRIIVPGAVIQTGMLGAASPDWNKKQLDTVKQQLAADPHNKQLQTKVAHLEKSYADDQKIVRSFANTLALAGQHTTINLTYCGAAGNTGHTDLFADLVRYLIGQGYTGLQLTLENEPNGSDHGDGVRGRMNHGFRTNNLAEARAAAKEYVDAYKHLNEDLADTTKGDVRSQVKIVGGDMVANRRVKFFKLIVSLGLNQYVDAYSFHIYWGTKTGLKGTLKQLLAIKNLAKHIAPGKALQITELGKEHYSNAAEKAANNGLNTEASEKGVANAFEQGLFELSAVNDGFVGVVKWDAFYGFTPERHKDPKTGKMKGDPRGNPGHFSMIDSHEHGDAMFRLMSMFTHAVEPGWRCHGTNDGTSGADAHFVGPDGKSGALLAMRKSGGSVSTASLPAGARLVAMTWNGNGNGGLETRTVSHGDHVHIPAQGAVAITTLG